MAKLDSARTVTLKALNKYHETDESSDLTIAELEGSLTDDRDRRFARQLFLGSIRWKLRLDWTIKKFSRQSRSRLKPTVENILRLGIFQIKFMERVPDRAAVDTSVNLAKENGVSYASGYINALLRNVVRSNGKETYPNPTNEPIRFLSVFYSHPQWLVKKWISRWGVELTTNLLMANNQPSRTWIRRNSLLCSPPTNKEDTLVEEGPDGFLFAKEPAKLFKSDFFIGGYYQVQDPAATYAVKLLSPQPGEKILDLCSAPGGKTTQIAELMKNKGYVLATDISLQRLKKVAANSKRLGLDIIRIAVRDGTSPFAEKFDRILLDVPCSGTGIIGRHADARWRKKPEQIAVHTKTQRQLLTSAFSSLRPGGVLVYSTCSLESEENEDIIEEFATNMPLAEIEPASDYLHSIEQKTCYFQSIPGKQIGDGAFAARIRKKLQ